jgi:hypothetical protein
MIIAVFCRRLVGEAARLDLVLPSLVPLLIATLGFAAAAVIVIAHQALRFSHRIVGPAYRLRCAFAQVKQGDLRRVKLRKGDHLVELADAFNELLDWLERQANERVAGEARRAAPAERAEPADTAAVGAGTAGPSTTGVR